MPTFHVCFLLCCDSNCYQLPALFSGFWWSMARVGDGVVYKEHWYLWEMWNKSLPSCQLYVVIASSWLVALPCWWASNGHQRVGGAGVQVLWGLEGDVWMGAEIFRSEGKVFVGVADAHETRECSFCLLLINNLLSSPVSYSICTLLAPYTAMDPTVISCVTSTTKRSFIPLCCKRYWNFLLFSLQATVILHGREIPCRNAVVSPPVFIVGKVLCPLWDASYIFDFVTVFKLRFFCLMPSPAYLAWRECNTHKRHWQSH